MSIPKYIPLNGFDALITLQSELHRLHNSTLIYQSEIKVLKQQVEHSETIVDQYNARNCNDYFGFMRRSNKDLEIRLVALHKDLVSLKTRYNEIQEQVKIENVKGQGNIINFVKINKSTNKYKSELQVNSLFDKLESKLDSLNEIQISIVNKTNVIIARMRDQGN